jgi:hypothetical protein
LINENIIKGDPSTTFYDLTFTTNGMDLIISGGTYTRNNNVIFEYPTGGTIGIPTLANMNYEVSLLETGTIHLLQFSDIEEAIDFYKSNKVIDLLAWFTVGEEVTSLDSVTINVKRMVNINERA